MRSYDPAEMQEIRQKRLGQLLGFEYFRLKPLTPQDCPDHLHLRGIAFRTATHDQLLRDLAGAQCRCIHGAYGLSRVSLRLALQDGKVSEVRG